jgi:hypothetical protein
LPVAALTVAVAVIAVFVLVSADDPARTVRPNVTRVSVTDTPISRPVAPGFVGFSLEYTTVEPYVGTDPGAINPVFVRLIRNVAPGGQPNLRIGGNSSDWGWFVTPGMKKPRGIRFSLSERFVPVLRALAAAAHARLILGLNLEARSRGLLAREAHALSAVGRPALTAFELGNEPEVFGSIQWYQTRRKHPVFARRRGYNYRDFNREFSSFSRLVPSSIPLAGPASGGPQYWAKTASFLASQPRVRIVTFHLYPLHRCFVDQRGATGPSIHNLLSPAASGGRAAGIAPYVPVAHAHGARLRVGEMNSVSCGGAPGVSDRFASALWSLDMLFHLAQEGVDGVNFHTFVKAYYRPFTFRHAGARWSANVTPMYYGLYAFAHAAPPGSRLLGVTGPGDPTLRVWATRAPDQRERVVLINTSTGHTRTVALRLGAVGRGRRASVERLTAPSLASARGVRLGGQFFARDTTSGRLTGPRAVSHPRQLAGGVYTVQIPAGSAAILTR